jgi:hypothetical protein
MILQEAFLNTDYKVAPPAEEYYLEFDEEDREK